MKRRELVFGYGSLINYSSKIRTVPSAGESYPVKINGYLKGWWARIPVPGLSTTFLGCLKEASNSIPQSSVNGVVFEVSEQELFELDKREIGYFREKVKKDYIMDYCDQITDDDTVWIYLNKSDNTERFFQVNQPNKKFPIVQSYVDLCINGCLELESHYPVLREKNFTQQFISETKCWNHFWVNDRIYPRRPFIHCPNAYLIDQLLISNLPDKEIFDKIYFE